MALFEQTDIKGDGSNAGENFLNGGGHFGDASTLTSFTNSSGQTFVLAGGDDDGVSLWTLDANGDLTLEATRDNHDIRNAGDEFLTSDHDVGLHDVNVAKFVEIDGQTYVFAGGQDDEIVTFRVDQAGNGDFSLNLVGQTGNIFHDISSMGVLPTGELVVGGEQQGLKFYDISVNGDGTVSLTKAAFVSDENEPYAELWDSEDIDIEGGILVSASDADSGIAVLDLYDRSPRNTDNLDDAGGIETNNTYATELVTLANGRLIMISSERGTATDGISTYEIDNDPASATYGQIIGTSPELSGHDDLGAKIDSIGGEHGRKVGYAEIADLASVTLANGRTFVYSADFEKDAIGVAEINPEWQP